MHEVHLSILLVLLLSAGCAASGAAWDPADRTAYVERCTARLVSSGGLAPQELDAFCGCTADELQDRYPSYADYARAPLTDKQERQLFESCGYKR